MVTVLPESVICKIITLTLACVCLCPKANATVPEPEQCRPWVILNEYDIRIARNARATKMDTEAAERSHFRHTERAIKSGEAVRNPIVYWRELEYMVLRYPNHIAALAMLDRLSLQLKVDVLPDSRNSVDCHFHRALRFVPDDMDVKTTYAIYLLKRDRTADAIDMLKEVESLQPYNANNHYNLGLAYLSAKQPEQAKMHAIKAYAFNFPLPGLKAKLKSAGAWGDAEEDAVRRTRETATSERAPTEPVVDGEKQ